MSSLFPIREVRITLTVASYEEAVQFYCDGLGLAVVEQWQTAEGRGMILALGPQTTLELFDADQAALVDRLEVGRRVSGPVRLAFQVPDVEAEVSALQQAGANVLSRPTLMRLSRSQCTDRNTRWYAIDTLSGGYSKRAAERRANLKDKRLFETKEARTMCHRYKTSALGALIGEYLRTFHFNSWHGASRSRICLDQSNFRAMYLGYGLRT